MAKEKEKKVKEKINWKKEAKLAPGYIIILLWVDFYTCASWMDRCSQLVYNERDICR